MFTILIADDEERIRRLVSDFLRRDGYTVLQAADGGQAMELIDQRLNTIDLIILDVMMPVYDGWSVLRHIRAKNREVPVMMLTARTEDTDEVFGFDLGADDYITKPFSLSVLRARVNTQLRKQISIHKNAAIHIDHFCFDFGTMTFCVGDTKVELSKTEQKLLHLLVENRGRTMNRGDLVDRIWTDGAEYVDENALSVTIKRLRDKLGAQEYIKTVYGIGYSWVKKDE